MKSTGIIRRIDQLGRIVLPMELRKQMRLREGTQLELSVEDEKIILTKHDLGSSLKEIAENILLSLPQSYSKIIVTDNDKVLIASKELRNYEGIALKDEIRLAYRSLESSTEFLFDGKYDYRYICSILKEGDRLGFVVNFSDIPFTNEQKEMTQFVSDFIGKQV